MALSVGWPCTYTHVRNKPQCCYLSIFTLLSLFWNEKKKMWVALLSEQPLYLISMFRKTQSAVHWVLSLKMNQSQSVKLIASTLASSLNMGLCGVLPFTPSWFLSHMKCRLLFKCIFKIIESKKGCKHLKILIFCQTDMVKY